MKNPVKWPLQYDFQIFWSSHVEICVFRVLPQYFHSIIFKLHLHDPHEM
jgi:hypothetical protein